MSDLRRNLDLVAIVVLVLLLGIVQQAPRVQERLYRAGQQQIDRSVRIPHIGRLIVSLPELR